MHRTSLEEQCRSCVSVWELSKYTRARSIPVPSLTFTIYHHNLQRKCEQHLALLNVALNSVPHSATGKYPIWYCLGVMSLTHF
ncbi:hypothetical protein PR048_019360 [Dryococelus australis]|uniref:Uncharacterized protein n=1 Tax=Dryococelus australis TaxID=614101 RepID=A0ABQ9H396_9NEOP|nr:hypothetical protein PR048_019360 [Dryococelus australis]